MKDKKVSEIDNELGSSAVFGLDSLDTVYVTCHHFFFWFNTAAGLARAVSRGRYHGNHHSGLPQLTTHGISRQAQEVHLVLWLHPVLHHTWRRATQPSHPAADTRGQWVNILKTSSA